MNGTARRRRRHEVPLRGTQNIPVLDYNPNPAKRVFRGVCAV